MTFLPIVERELRLASRRGWTYWLRVILGAIAVAVVGMALGFHLATGSRTAVGGAVFPWLATVLLMLCCFVGVFVTGDCLSEEKREGTLGLLFLTDLKGFDVVLGKLIATSTTTFSGLLAIFPVLGIVLLLGGVSPGEFARTLSVLVNTLFFSLAAGLLASAANVSERKSRGWTLGLILLALAGTPLIEVALATMGIGNLPPLSAASPLTSLRMASDVSYLVGPHRFWNSLLVIHLAGWLFIVIASVILPRRWREGTEPDTRRTRRPAVVVSEKLRARRRSLLDADPVTWIATRRTLPAWVFGAICSVTVVAVGAGTWAESGLGVAGVPIIAWLLGLVIRTSIVWQSTRFFSESRKSGALELLLCTPLTNRELIRGQWVAVRRHYLIPVLSVVCLYLIGAAAILWSGGSNTFPMGGLPVIGYLLGMQAYRVVRFATEVFAAISVGMLMGLIARRPGHAAGLATLFVVVLPEVAFCIPSVIVLIPLSLWAWDRVRREVRTPDGGRILVQPHPPASAPPSHRIPPLLKSE